MIRPARSSPDPGAENPRGVCLVTPPSKPHAVRRGARPKPTSTPTRAARGLTASRLSKHGARNTELETRSSKHGARNTELGAAHAREPGLAASEARMAKRSRHAVSEGHDARSERPATGHGQPRAAHHTRSPSLTRLGSLTERTSGERHGRPRQRPQELVALRPAGFLKRETCPGCLTLCPPVV